MSMTAAAAIAPASAALARQVSRAAADRGLLVGGLTPFTSIDFPGRLAAVVFVAGCAWRCVYCHNPHLQPRERGAGAPDWPQVLAWLRTRVGLLDGVVFSGGEPCTDPALPQALAQVRALGMATGLHTAGLYPRRLAAVLPLLDWVGLDIKAPLDDPARYAAITGVPGGAQPVRESLALLLAGPCPFECRTTAHPDWLDDDALIRLADELADAGVTDFALQLARAEGTLSGLRPVPAGYPAPATLESLRHRLPLFGLRRG